ncbi:GGDEF domain-containing protein [Asanoa sp. NPDC049573]|uniref:GGDEF domain-containing protein n=1 Tax=Asanoa sp. NPDC049573 TaxID=3155396 RepID=UPI00341A3F0B
MAFGGTGAAALVHAFRCQTLRRELQHARYRATHDPLTGAPNRAAVYDHLQRSVERGTALCVAIADVNGLKWINDSFGHAAGDRVLRHVAARLASAIPGGLVARLGGDEFVIIMPGDPSAGWSAACRAERAIASQPVPLQGQCCTITASIGVAATLGKAESPSRLLRRADSAMYVAKRTGVGVSACEAS